MCIRDRDTADLSYDAYVQDAAARRSQGVSSAVKGYSSIGGISFLF